MFGWDDAEQSHEQVYGGDGYDHPERKGKFSHEMIAGGAAFAGFKAYEDHQRAEGKTVDHAFAKELLAGFVGGEVDKLAETHGMNEYDKIEARRRAEHNAHNMYDQHYIQNQQADNYNPNQYGPPQQLRYNNYNNNNY